MRLSSRVLVIAIPSLLMGVALGSMSIGIASSIRGSAIFPDVLEGTFYDEAVGEMYEAGIIRGYSNGQFGPNDFVTRGQIAVMMQRLREELQGSRASSSVAQSSSSSTSSSSSSSSSSSTNVNGSFRFTNTVFTIPETVPDFSLSVVRSGGTAGAVSVAYSVKAGTATAGTNFVAVTNSVVQFADGETTKTISVDIMDDPRATGQVTVLLELLNPTGGASLGSPSTATLNILDKDGGNTSSSSSSSTSGPTAGTIGFSALAYEVVESVGSATFTIVRTGGSVGQVGVSYATSDKTATAGNKYSSTSGTLTFAAGETSKTIAVPIIDNVVVDGKKTFGITLSAPTGGAAIASPSSVTVSIADNEVGTFGTGSFLFVRGSVSVLRSERQVVLTVNRVGGTLSTVSVNFATVAGSAIAGRDFTATSGTLTFLVGESSKNITIPILTSSTPANGAYFTVTLSNPTGGSSLDSPSVAQVTVFD